MKRLTRLLFLIPGLCLLAGLVHGQQKNSLTVLGTPLILKEEKKDAPQYLAEYIPAGETFDNFTIMFAVWGRRDGSTAASQLKAKIQFVTARKGTDPLANFSVFRSDDQKTLGLDFLISQGDVMEHNVWSFQDVPGGVLAYQYARRHYEGKSSTSGDDFIKGIPEARNKTLTFFKTAVLPKPRNLSEDDTITPP